MKALTTKTTTATTDNRNSFATLIQKYNESATDRYTLTACDNEKEYSKALTDLATAVAYSVLKKCINTSSNKALESVRRDLASANTTLADTKHANDNATRLTYNENGDLVQEVLDKDLESALTELCKRTIGDGLDLVNTAVVTLMEETDRQNERNTDTSDCHTIDLERTYTVRRLKKKVWIKKEDSVNGWEDVETSPIREVYKAVRRYIDKTSAMATDPRNGYSYLEDMSYDTESGESEVIYRRLTKYSNLGGYATDFNGACTLYTVDGDTVDKYETLVASLNLTKKQAQVLSLRQSGYGYKAIATYLGVTQRAVAKTVEAIQKKAIAIGLDPNK